MADLDQFVAPTPDAIRDANLRVRRNGLIARGVPDPNVAIDSDHWVYAEAIASNVSPAYQNTVIKADQLMPDTAVNAELVRNCSIYGIELPFPVGATGKLAPQFSTSSFVPVGAQLTDSVGNVFEVSVGGTYAPTDQIPVEGITTGKGTDHEAGDVLLWASAPGGSAATALVASPGLIGGTDPPTNDSLRALLLAHLQNPVGGGNWSQVQGWALKADPAVNAAFVYPAVKGPATLALSILGTLTYTGSVFTREVTSSVLALVDGYVKAQLPERERLNTTTPTVAATRDTAVDISIGLSLPQAIGAGGPGGGWTDANPWPVLNGTATRCTVSVATDSTHLTLTSDDSGTTPSSVSLIDGATQVAWFSPAAWALDPTNPLVVATVVSHGGTTGALTVVLSTPFTGIQVGDYIFPNAENAQVYAQAFMDVMATLGPGQLTTAPAYLPRAYRHPLVGRAQPSSITAAVLKPITDSGDEVDEAVFLYRSATAVTVPSDTDESPYVFVPRRFGFYDQIP